MTEYYIIDHNGNQVGPISEVLFCKYGVDRSTYVWCEGMPEWKHAGEVAELQHLFGPVLPPPPPVSPFNTAIPPIYDEAEATPPGPCPPSYLGWAIAATLLCCMPFGVVSLVYASKVSSCWRYGEYAEAYKASRYARNWLIASVVSAGVVYVLIFLSSFLVYF